ncbi:MAG: CoA transferase [Alphaproteobacteria bacterium]
MTAWSPLAGMRVVEACERLVGPLAGWHLAMLGAEVIKVEPPEGDIARAWDGGALFDVINAGKRFAALDLAKPSARAAFERLCAGADAVLADSGWSDQAALKGSRRKGARTSAAVIVDSGPVPGGTGNSETLAQAAMAVTPYVGEPEGAPVRIGADIASASAAAAATQAVLAGLWRERDAAPLVARVSCDRALAALKTIHWAARSDPDRWQGYHLSAMARQPDRGYRVRDGRVSLDFPPDKGAGWLAFCRELGLAQFAAEVGDDWYSTIGMEDRIDWARKRYEDALAAYTREEASALIRKHGGWSVAFLTPEEMLHHPQAALYASAWLAGGAPSVRLPWRVGDHAQGVHAPKAAPPIGAHSKEVLAELRAEVAS